MKKYLKVSILLFLFIVTACSNQEDGHNSRLALIKTTNPKPVELVKDPENDSIGHAVKKEISKMDTLYDVAVIQKKDTLLVTYKVKHFHRFKMKDIEAQMEKKLKGEYPDKDFILSSDYKIFLETVRLQEKMEEGTISQEEAKREFDDIVALQRAKA